MYPTRAPVSRKKEFLLPTLLVIISSIANALFNKTVNEEVKHVLANPGDKNEVVTRADLAGMPACVQKWLEYSGVIGKEKIRTVRLRQKGMMRTTEQGKWMPAEAEQYFSVDEPGFVWKARIKAAPLVYLSGRDMYFHGRGSMLIKLLSLVPVVNSAGKEMDQGTLLRYLAEMQWFPTAALNNYITWEEIDANSARATMSYKGVTASGVFTFDGEGRLTGFTAKRYRELNGSFVLSDWGGTGNSYRDFNGFRIPDKGRVFWKTDKGKFEWYQWEITEIEYN